VTVSDASAWIALVAAILSIGVEIWKALTYRRKARGAAGSDSTPAARGAQYRVPPFFRGAGTLSFLPIAGLILAAHALGLYSDELYFRAREATSQIDKLQYDSSCSFVRAVVIMLALVIAVLLFRAVGNGIARWYFYYVPEDASGD
jgi:hypothetical protein